MQNCTLDWTVASHLEHRNDIKLYIGLECADSGCMPENSMFWIDFAVNYTLTSTNCTSDCLLPCDSAIMLLGLRSMMAN